MRAIGQLQQERYVPGCGDCWLSEKRAEAFCRARRRQPALNGGPVQRKPGEPGSGTAAQKGRRVCHAQRQSKRERFSGRFR
jgi:hypothetical protein